MLYRVGVHLLAGDEKNNDIILATEFFGITLSNGWFSFVKGNIFERPPDEPVRTYSDCPFVTSTSTAKVFSSGKILRKLMLFPDPDSSTSFVACDFMKPKPPLMLEDIIVPVHPKLNDTVNVRGNDDEVWFAHVLSVDLSAKTCRIHFYIEDSAFSGRYTRETLGRLAMENIHWNSIIQIASGQWVDRFRVFS